MAKMSLVDSILDGIEDETEEKQPKKKAKKAPAFPEYKAPSPKEMAVDAAHRAHRDTLEGWIRGDVSDAKMRKASARLKKATKGRGY